MARKLHSTNPALMALEEFRGAVKQAEAQQGSNTYPHQYRRARKDTVSHMIRLVLEGVMSPEQASSTIVNSELLQPITFKNRTLRDNRRKAMLAMLTDERLSDPLRLQSLIEIETGSPTLAGTNRGHESITQEIIKNTKRTATNGLVLAVDYTEANNYGIREFSSAAPYKLDVSRLAQYRFELKPGELSYKEPELLTDESGLYFTLAAEAISWQAKNGRPNEQSIQAYGVHRTTSDAELWVPSMAPQLQSSSHGMYPPNGQLMLRGQVSIAEFAKRLVVNDRQAGHAAHEGYLAKLQADIGDYPGFGFVHNMASAIE